MPPIFDYLRPELPAGLRRVGIPIVAATPETLRGYGNLLDDPDACAIEIVRWPATGSRPVDADTGDQGGTTEGVFVAEWQGDILFGHNEAVGGHYILAYAADPVGAKKLIAVGESKADERLAPAELAAWTMLANTVLNLDEVLNKG